jgi:hypothetical protein
VSRDDEIAREILKELDRPATDLDCVLTYFRYLREDIKEIGVFAPGPIVPRFSDEKKKLRQIAAHAKRLAFCIKDLSPSTRHLLAINMYFETDRTDDPDLKLGELLADLIQIAHQADVIQSADPCVDRKDSCASAAWTLMNELGLEPTKYFRYYRVAGLMYQALTGKEADDMKRACDRTINEMNRRQRFAQELIEAGLERYLVPRK